MKTKTLTKKEITRKVRKTLIEVFSSLFVMSDKTAAKKVHAAIEEGTQSDSELLMASFLYWAYKDIKRINIKPKRQFTEAELEAALAQFKAYAPEMVSTLRKELKDMAKKLPRRGGPGREEILNATGKREVCEQVGSLHKMGKLKRWPDIFETVAETFRLKGKEISARTIKRIWQSRDTLYVG